MNAYVPPIYHFQATHHNKTVHVAAPNTPTARLAAQRYFHTHKNVLLVALRRG
jgi:hypothetical protein